MKTLLIILVIIVVVIVFLLLFKNEEGELLLSPKPTPEATTQTHTISMNEQGFSPLEITIRRGDSVRFLNTGSQNFWPASGIHPTHQICLGLDPLELIGPGESFTFTFSEVKECPFHNHLTPFDEKFKGRIIVQ